MLVVSSAVAAILLAAGLVAAFRRKAVAALAFTLSLVLFSVTLGMCLNAVSDGGKTLATNAEHRVEGTIDGVSSFGADGTSGYILDDITVDGAKTKGKIRLYVTADDGSLVALLKYGDRVAFTAPVNEYKVSYRGASEYRFESTVGEAELTFAGGTPTFFQRLHNKMRVTLMGTMGDLGGVAYAMLTGSKAYVDDGIRNAYTASGIGHVLAVSGLHVGVLVAALEFLLRKLRVGRVPKAIVEAAVLLFYCFLAGFSASVVRASIMCVTGLAATLIGERRDTLNALGLAVTVILVFDPLALFDVGFQMSAGSVFCILLFTRPIKRILRFLPDKLASAIAASAAAELGILPPMLAVFNQFAIYGVIFNVIAIPVFGACFVLIGVCLIIVLIFPAAGILLTVSGIPLALVDTLAEAVSRIPHALVIAYASNRIYLAYPLYFACSRFFMLRRAKFAIVPATAVIMAAIVAAGNVPLAGGYDIIALSQYKDVTTLVRTDEGVIAVGDCGSYYALSDMMSLARERRVAAMFVNSLSPATAAAIIAFSETYAMGAVYCPYNVDFSGIYDLVGAGISFYLIGEGDETDLGITPIFSPSFCGYIYERGGAAMLTLGYGMKIADVPLSVINRAAIVRTYTYSGEYGDRIYLANYTNSFISERPMKQPDITRGLAINSHSGEARELFD